MRFASVLPFLLVPFALASPTPEAASLEERKNAGDPAGAKKIRGDVTALTKGVKTLNDTVNTFMPDAILTAGTALKIQQETTDLENILKQAVSDAQASGKLNNGQSGRVGIQLLEFVPQIQSLLKNIVRHKKAFETVLVGLDLSKMVESSLKTQQMLSAEFGKAVAAKLTPEFASQAPAINREIKGYFEKAIKAFAQCSGLICVPS